MNGLSWLKRPLGMLLPLCIAFSLQVAARPIRLNYTRPSVLVEKLAGGGLLGNVRVKPDDRHGVILAAGAPADIEQLRTYIEIFDHRLRHLRFEVELTSEIDRRAYRDMLTISNNSTASLTHEDLGAALELAGRINDDGTVTLFGKMTLRKQGRKWSTRVRSGDTIEVDRSGLLTNPSVAGPGGGLLRDPIAAIKVRMED